MVGSKFIPDVLARGIILGGLVSLLFILAILLRRRQFSGADIDLDRVQEQQRRRKLAVALVAHGDILVLSLVARPVTGDTSSGDKSRLRGTGLLVGFP